MSTLYIRLYLAIELCGNKNILLAALGMYIAIEK